MTRPSRRPVEPLRPPPGAFEAVLRRAHARRNKRAGVLAGITGVFLAGLAGGVSISGGDLTGVRQQVAAVARLDGAGASTTTPPAGGSTTTAASSTRNTTSGSPRRTAAATGGGTSRVAVVRGRAVDPGGAPIAGLYVYTGRVTTGSFVPSRAAAAVTGAQGGFTVPCTSGPVLLTDWPLNAELGARAGARWAATFMASPRCTASGTPQVTTIREGGVVTGRVRTDVACEGVEFPVWLWVWGNRSASVRLSGLREGDRYRVAGVPAGTSVLGARGRPTAVTLAGSQTVNQDVTFACPTGPTATGTPTDTASPTVEPTGGVTSTPPESTPAQTGPAATSPGSGR